MKPVFLSNDLTASLELLHALKEEGLILMPLVPDIGMIAAASKIAGLSADKTNALYAAFVQLVDNENSGKLH